MIDGITIGAYAIEPSDLAGREEEWYDKLARIEGAHGLEIPFRGTLHPDGAARLAALLPKGWHVVITMLPATMAGIGADPRYGLASTDDDGRDAALRDVLAALAEGRRLAEATGRQTVSAIHLASAPRATGTAERLARSLEQLGADARGVRLLVEHCDAWTDDHPVEKGFLSLADEIEAVLAARENTDAVLGQVINWGRSAIEGRSTLTPRQHLSALTSAGTLAGLMFSGASATGGPLGAAWADAHNPLDSADSSSLLSAEEVEATLGTSVANGAAVLGVKVQDATRAEGFDERLTPLQVTVAAVRARLESLAG